jgi:hypothetical protein
LKDLPEEEEKKPMEYYWEKGYIDNIRLHILLRKIIDMCELPYHIGLGRSRYQGIFDPNFIPPQAISDFFFSIQDDSAKSHIVVPGYDQFYAIDEIPFYFKATEALLLGKPQGVTGEVTDISEIQLPLTPHEFNYRLRLARINISSQDKDSVTYKCKETLSGDLSTTYRYDLMKYKEGKLARDDGDKNKEPISRIEFYQTEENNPDFPFLFKCSYKVKQPVFVHFINGNSCYIMLEDVLEHNISKVNDGNRVLDYYPVSTYSDVNKLVLSFDREIASDNLDQVARSIENEYAGIKVDITRGGPSLVSIDVKYEIRKWKIEAEQIDKLRAINKSLNELYKSKIVFTFKG